MLPHPDIYRAVKNDYARQLHGAAANTHGPRPHRRVAVPFTWLAGLVSAPVVRVRRRRKPKLAYLP
jgi:hypothetical protein